MIARVVSVPYSMLPGATPGAYVEVAAAVRRGRVDVDDRLAPVQLLHHRPVGRVAEPRVAVARHQADAVSLDHVVGVRDLLQRGVDIRQRHRGEQPEARRMILHQRRAVVVAGAGEAPRDRRVAEPQAGIRDRHDGRGHAAAIHVLDRLGRRPGGIRRLQQRPALDLHDPGRRREMMVDVDAVRLAAAGAAPL